MSEQLKPCPFCGDVHFREMDMTFMHADGATKGKKIKCVTCGAQAPDRVWNVREADAALAAKDARIAELEQKNDNLHAVMSAMELNDAMRHERAQRHEPVAYVLFRDGEVCYEADDNIVISNLPGDSSDLYQWLPVFTNPTMAKNANVAATPSEDGGEVPEFRDVTVTAIDDAYHDDIGRTEAVNRIVAQHSRIVAAKDAEIARLRELHENAHSAAKTLMAERATLMEQAAHWLEVNAPSGGCIETNIADELRVEAEQLRAQPPCQVGGDWPKLDKPAKVGGGRFNVGVSARLVVEAAQRQYEYDVTPEKEAERIAKAAGLLGSLQGARQVGVDAHRAFNYSVLHDFAYKHGLDYNELCSTARAALAPAAVVVDSSAPLVNALEQVRTMVGNDEYADDVIGFINRSIYNHANLNRRAIPVELLKKVLAHIDRNTCTHEETHRGGAIWEICDSCGAKWADDEGGKPEFKWPDYVEELRALLSQQQEGGV